jgi:dephospho-CoA kinase
MIKVGLTGNIGSGKSTVCRIFETLGVPVFHADEVAKEMLKEERIQQQIRTKFGNEVFDGNILDRKKLASIVFVDKEALTFLNSLIHPEVRKKLKRWFDEKSDHHYVIEEAAILIEGGSYIEFDKIIMVTAPPELSIKRVMDRDGVKKEDIENRLLNQWSQQKKIELSHFVIHNDEKQLLIPQVLAIHHQLIK